MPGADDPERSRPRRFGSADATLPIVRVIATLRLCASLYVLGAGLSACTSAEKPVKTHWLELEVVDWKGRAFPGLELQLAQDSELRTISLDAAGRWSSQELTGPGPVLLTLPSLRRHRADHPVEEPETFTSLPTDISITWDNPLVTVELDREYRLVAKADRICFSC